MGEDSLDVGILLNTESVTEWQRRALVALFESDKVDARPTVLIINAEQTETTTTIRTHLSEFSLWKILRITHLLKYIFSGRPWHNKRVDITQIEQFGDVERVYCEPQPAEGLGSTLPGKAVDSLADTDIVVRFGFGIVKDDALTAPTYGMLSYHHGDLRKYRGRPAGFHEFRNGEKTAGVTVQKLNESLDGGDIAAFTEVPIHDVISWSEALSRLYEASDGLLPEAVAKCVSDTLETNPSRGDLYRMPTTRQTLEYIREKFRRPYDPPKE
jgi:hypothetical protein